MEAQPWFSPILDTMEADWALLPEDLLRLISTSFTSPIQVVTFRSVCQSWRRSTPLPLFRFNIPSLLSEATVTVERRMMLTLAPRQHHHHQKPWLIKFSQRELLHPFYLNVSYRVQIGHGMRVIHVGDEYAITSGKTALMKVVVGKGKTDGDYRVLSLVDTAADSPNLALHLSSEAGWRMIGEKYQDICSFKQELCAVDENGRSVSVNLRNCSLDLVAEPIVGGGGKKKQLVEAKAKLLLVDKYLVDIDGDGLRENPYKIDIYQLDQKNKTWVPLVNLDDGILFLASSFNFAASTQELGLNRKYGNSIISEKHFYWGRVRYILDEKLAVSNLVQDGFYKQFPAYSPDWINN